MEKLLEAPEFVKKLRKNFFRDEKAAMAKIYAAIEAGDFDTAHRLAHTLKGLAGIIGEEYLFELARNAEISLSKGVKPASLDGLCLEMERVLDEIGKMIQEDLAAAAPGTALDADEVNKIFDKVVPLLESSSFEVVDLVDEIAKIPDTDELIRQIECFEFDSALETIALRLSTDFFGNL